MGGIRGKIEKERLIQSSGLIEKIEGMCSQDIGHIVPRLAAVSDDLAVHVQVIVEAAVCVVVDPRDPEVPTRGVRSCSPREVMRTR